METDTPKQPNKAIIAIVVVALLAIITAAVLLLGKKDTPAVTTSETTPTPTAIGASGTSPSAPSDSNSAYKDGTYKSSGSYQSPGGNETVDLTVTLAGGVITGTDLVNHPSTRDAQDYQSRFIGGYKSLVVGKKIDTISLSRVAGSSLTSGGFNKALSQIKSDAKA